jgi:hypothetical protein
VAGQQREVAIVAEPNVNDRIPGQVDPTPSHNSVWLDGVESSDAAATVMDTLHAVSESLQTGSLSPDSAVPATLPLPPPQSQPEPTQQPTGRRRVLRQHRDLELNDSLNIFDYLDADKSCTGNRRVYVLRDMVRLTGSPVAGLVLAQVCYWMRPQIDDRSGESRPLQRARWWYDGHYCLRQGQPQFAKGLGIPLRQLKQAVKELKAADHIVTAYHGSERVIDPAAPMKSYDPESYDEPERRRGRYSMRLSQATARVLEQADPTGQVVYPLMIEHLIHSGLRPQPAVASAIVLGYVSYWFGKDRRGRCRLRVQAAQGHPMLAKTYRALSDDTGLTLDQTRRAVAYLKDAKLIETQVLPFSGETRVLHMWPCPPEIENAWHAALIRSK